MITLKKGDNVMVMFKTMTMACLFIGVVFCFQVTGVRGVSPTEAQRIAGGTIGHGCPCDDTTAMTCNKLDADCSVVSISFCKKTGEGGKTCYHADTPCSGTNCDFATTKSENC